MNSFETRSFFGNSFETESFDIEQLITGSGDQRQAGLVEIENLTNQTVPLLLSPLVINGIPTQREDDVLFLFAFENVETALSDLLYSQILNLAKNGVIRISYVS